MLTPPVIFVYFEVNYARVTPRQRSSFQTSDWLVWQLCDCVWVFFHLEVDTLESSARSKCCWLEQISYLRRFWNDILYNTVDDIEKHLMSLVAVNMKYKVQTKNITDIDLFRLNDLCKLWVVVPVFKVHLSTFNTWRIKLRFKININCDVQTTSHNCFRSLKKKIIVMKPCCRCKETYSAE